ncbi:hypothetical protein I4U23_006204 [Adineta vaga]|nr:hypothetical protein I4U23_006204 [Adineta vaga]
MSSQLKQICNTIYQEQVQSIRDLTSGHLNENHLYHPRETIDGKRKPTWSSSQKPHPTLRPSHHLKTYSNTVEEMKDCLVDFTYVSLPELPKKQTPRANESPSVSSSITSEQLPRINNERIHVPTFSIDLSEEQRVRKMKTFNDKIIQTKDVNLHGLGYSEDFVALVEQTLLMKLTTIDNEHKRQILSLSRLQAYGDAMNQLIEGSVAFGPVLERIKNEYELYLDHLLINQPEHGSHIAEQLKRLRQSTPRFSATSSELFDIQKIEDQTRQAIERNRQLKDELKRAKQQQIKSQNEASDRIHSIVTTEIRVKTQAELVDDLRQKVFDLLDELTRKKQELNDKSVHISVCSLLQQAIRDTQMVIFNTSKDSERLLIELDKLEQRIRKEITKQDQSEFTEEHIVQILELLKKFDVLHMKKSISGEDNTDDINFLHTYDDYFS